MKHKIIKIITLLVFIIAMLVGGSCASCERELKSCNADIAGGMNMRVIVYDFNGDILAQYEGFIDISTERDNCILFDLNGKRIIWYNAIVEIEEI